MEHYEETDYGFEWGALEVRRVCSYPKYGNVVGIRVNGAYKLLVRVSPKGEVVDVEVVEPRTKVRIPKGCEVIFEEDSC